MGDEIHQIRRPGLAASCAPPPHLASSGQTAEPVDGWRQMAGQVAAVLEISDRIKRRRPAPPDLWEPLRPLYPTGLTLPADPPPSGRLVPIGELPE